MAQTLPLSHAHPILSTRVPPLLPTPPHHVPYGLPLNHKVSCWTGQALCCLRGSDAVTAAWYTSPGHYTVIQVSGHKSLPQRGLLVPIWKSHHTQLHQGRRRSSLPSGQVGSPNDKKWGGHKQYCTDAIPSSLGRCTGRWILATHVLCSLISDGFSDSGKWGFHPPLSPKFSESSQSPYQSFLFRFFIQQISECLRYLI